MPQNLQVLEAARINTIMQALQDVRELPQQLVFLNRTPTVPATDGEIIGRYIGRVQIADLIADDQRAVVYSSGKLTFETTAIPNLKVGAALTQEQLNQLYAIQARGGVQNDNGIFTQWERRLIDGLRLGIQQRKEALLVAMAIDGFSYDRLGIRMINVSWGMPADLKVTVGTAWDHLQPGAAGDATPVTDVLTQKRLAAVRYGITYNRLTMSTDAFIYMTGTTEFQNKARFVLPPGQPTSILPLQGTAYMKNLATSVLDVDEIELYDARYWSQAADGTLASARYLPVNKVVLSSTLSDGDAMVQDFANAVVTESLVAGLTKDGALASLGGAQYGPIAYPTVEDNLNPPQVTYWGVARGFPRKHMLQATSVLTVGTFSDLIAVGEPF